MTATRRDPRELVEAVRHELQHGQLTSWRAIGHIEDLCAALTAALDAHAALVAENAGLKADKHRLDCLERNPPGVVSDSEDRWACPDAGFFEVPDDAMATMKMYVEPDEWFSSLRAALDNLLATPDLPPSEDELKARAARKEARERIKAAIARLVNRENLSVDEVGVIVADITEGYVTPAQGGAFIAGVAAQLCRGTSQLTPRAGGPR